MRRESSSRQRSWWGSSCGIAGGLAGGGETAGGEAGLDETSTMGRRGELGSEEGGKKVSRC